MEKPSSCRSKSKKCKLILIIIRKKILRFDSLCLHLKWLNIINLNYSMSTSIDWTELIKDRKGVVTKDNQSVAI
jgi:hypothetical protein